MILRLFSFVALLYALGFALFSVTLGEPAREDAPETAAIVVLTGGKGRIEQAVDRLAAGKAERLLIAGADPVVTEADLVERLGGKDELIACCVDLGSESVDTRSNAEEAHRWIEKHGYRELRLVTSDWHMRRAAYEFRREMGDEVDIIFDAVPTRPGLFTLFGEYNKYVLRRIGVLMGV
ncbi:YdcF family protein [Sphingomicrobium lutaoense]|uniref:Uncharacterized SAM-binding protein YcdF (DUF218 family) n=1 Tax=Sphingomicrobium lutaoense TaxID=515949 RepID=A0A839YXA0_9SPHN|nr:YdcF family protein [Sphingomicrobium lutaoense]MBB3764821.1 uncharacterized SAM-binding protein YcdF (DUF218 family) [Sphingomicrobium lutaoense]